MIHDEFKETNSTKIITAVEKRLRSDSALLNYFKRDGIQIAEVDILASENDTSYPLPSLLILPSGYTDEPRTNRQWDRIDSIEIVFVDRLISTTNTQDLLRRRILDHIKSIILGDLKTGQLEDSDGNAITKGNLKLNTVPAPAAPQNLPDRMFYRMTAVYESTVDWQSQLVEC